MVVNGIEADPQLTMPWWYNESIYKNIKNFKNESDKRYCKD